MRLLYIGDIMGSFGRQVLAEQLPVVIAKHQPDVVLAQAENVTNGKGISRQDYDQIRSLGVDGFMSGNHIYACAEILPLLDDPDQPITQPANYPKVSKNVQYKILKTTLGDIALVTLLGQIVGKDADVPTNNPLLTIDSILKRLEKHKLAATVVNFHGDYSSEKVIIGQYLDGRVTAVIGDHWHVPTADARILPGGTAHISDVGMVGSLNSSLGVKTDIVVKRWRGEKQGRNELEEKGDYQFCSVLIDINPNDSRASTIKQIIQISR